MYSPFYSLTSELTITSHSKTNTLKLPGRSTVTSHYIEVASWTAALRRTLFLVSKLTKGLVLAFCRSLDLKKFIRESH
ncbi:unnamed protein product [Rhodiola kirilowii]